MFGRWRLTLSFLAALWPTAHLAAQNARGPESFADSFVAAISSHDPERRKELIHPLTRACMNSETQPYYDWIFSRRERFVTPVGYKVTAIPISRVPGELPSDGKSDYPVRPTHQLQIDFGTATKGATVLLFVAQARGAWREVLPCPRADVVAQAKANQIAGQQLAEKVDTLVRGMPVELRAEITALLQAGRKVDAIKRYAAATHEDLSTAKSVIESLESR